MNSFFEILNMLLFQIWILSKKFNNKLITIILKEGESMKEMLCEKYFNGTVKPTLRKKMGNAMIQSSSCSHFQKYITGIGDIS